jgi:hypothetical protein
MSVRMCTLEQQLRAIIATGAALLAAFALTETACKKAAPAIAPPIPLVVVTRVTQRDVLLISEWVGTTEGFILIVEFARAEIDQGQTLVAAALAGARQRLRPILMTSFAFIFGLALWMALGTGAVARRVIGTVTLVGMLFSSAFAIFLLATARPDRPSPSRRGSGLPVGARINFEAEGTRSAAR